MYAESPPARDSILDWIQNFDDRGRVGDTQASGRPGTSSNQEERVSQDSLGQNFLVICCTTTLQFGSVTVIGREIAKFVD